MFASFPSWQNAFNRLVPAGLREAFLEGLGGGALRTPQID